MPNSERTLRAIVTIFAAKVICVATLLANIIICIAAVIDSGYTGNYLLAGTLAGITSTVAEATLVWMTFNALTSILSRRITGTRSRWRSPGHSDAGTHDLTDPASGTGWRALCLAAALMPPDAGRRWLAEAASCLHETTPATRGALARNFLLTAPQVAAIAWTGVLARSRLATSGRAPTGQHDGAQQ